MTHEPYREANPSESPFDPGCQNPGSLNGIIESKKSAERRKVISEENREWTDRPKRHKHQTDQGYDLVHIPSMRKTRTRLRFLPLTVVETLAKHDSSRVLVSPKKYLTCQCAGVSFLVIKESVSMDAANESRVVSTRPNRRPEQP